jgi:hypothetical protein
VLIRAFFERIFSKKRWFSALDEHLNDILILRLNVRTLL